MPEGKRHSCGSRKRKQTSVTGRLRPSSSLAIREALLIYVAVDGITSFLFEETHHMEFTQEKPGGQTVNCEVGGRIFRDIAHDFQNLFAAGAGAYIFQMAPRTHPVQMDHKLQKKNTAVQFFGIAVFPACFFKGGSGFHRELIFRN